MARLTFVDSGAWIAVTDLRDQYHSDATLTYRRLLGKAEIMVTTNLVIAESYNAIRRTMGHATAIRFLQSVRPSRWLRRIASFTEIEDRAEATLIRYADQAFSLTDAVSFAVMRDLGVQVAFAFDHHFSTAGFTMLPER